MTLQRAIMNRLLLLSPWLTVLALLGMSHALPNRVEPNPLAEVRKQEVATAMQAVPFFIGRWVAEEAALPREAQKLLRPNAMFSREFQTTDGPPVRVVVIHCGDARDMIGHYPPICYPSSGWVQAAAPRDVTLQVNGRDFPVCEYRYNLLTNQSGGRGEAVRIFNAFILPDGRVTADIGDIHRQSDRMSVAVQGVAQLQVTTPAAAKPQAAMEAANEILSGMDGLLTALGCGDSNEE